jgi:uncharacterized membrane protein
VSRRRRNARNARWFAAYSLVLLVIAGVTLGTGQYSLGLTVLLAALVFGWFTWRSWRKARRVI